MKLILALFVFAYAAQAKSYAAWCKDKGWHFCSNTKKCGDGLGDCDSNAQCKSGLTCVSSDSKYPKLGSFPTDCCKCPSTTGNGGWHSCSVNCKCGHNQGDCDSNSQCKSGTECRSSSPTQALIGSAKDYCCNSPPGWHACNTGNCKCRNGQGDCDSDKQCDSGLVCLPTANGQTLGQGAKDVCTKIIKKGWGGCSVSKKCGHGEGDCDRDSQCKSGHVCTSTLVGQKISGYAYDVCVKKILTDETEGVDEADAEAEIAEAAEDVEGEAEPVEDEAVQTTEAEPTESEATEDAVAEDATEDVTTEDVVEDTAEIVSAE